MKLYKALKLKKTLLGEISNLKKEIKEHNSYLVGSKNSEKFNVKEAYIELYEKINNLVALKYVINESNREIQDKIYKISEFKGLIAFLNDVSVKEGSHSVGYSEQVREYSVHMDNEYIKNLISEYQKKVDALQDDIDVFNHTTDIPWNE